MLDHEPFVFLFGLGTEFTVPRTIESAVAFIHALNFVVMDDGCGAIHAFELLDREWIGKFRFFLSR